MKKPSHKDINKLLTAPPHKPTLVERLGEAEAKLKEAERKGYHIESLRQNIESENTRLSKIIEGLKEDLFNKSLALAHAEGQLQRVDHEDAERAEVIILDDMKTSKVHHEGGFDVNGPAVPYKRAVLKYNLGHPPQRTMGDSTLSLRSDEYGRPVSEKPKHWVNRH